VRSRRASVRDMFRAARRKVRVSRKLAKRELTNRVIEPGVRSRILPRRVKHVHGPSEIVYEPDELLVLSVVRNGELYVKSFLEHYISMGAKHIIFLDNGSTDGTVDALCGHDQVTVLQADVPYQRYENVIKNYLTRRFARGRWSLFADIDELFDYPFSTALSLRDFLNYLNEYRYTAVIAQMLDMFSATPLSQLESKVDDRLADKYKYYELSSIRKSEYTWPGLDKSQINWHWGGVRERVFGTNNSLTKAALIFLDGKLKPFVEWHHVRGARIADVSCVLRHYPFVSTFRVKAEEAARTNRYASALWEYSAYWAVLERDPNIALHSDSARTFHGLEPLIDDEFLVVSEKYMRWVDAHARSPKAEADEGATTTTDVR
jgi:hypothetical protein